MEKKKWSCASHRNTRTYNSTGCTSRFTLTTPLRSRKAEQNSWWASSAFRNYRPPMQFCTAKLRITARAQANFFENSGGFCVALYQRTCLLSAPTTVGGRCLRWFNPPATSSVNFVRTSTSAFHKCLRVHLGMSIYVSTKSEKSNLTSLSNSCIVNISLCFSSMLLHWWQERPVVLHERSHVCYSSYLHLCTFDSVGSQRKQVSHLPQILWWILLHCPFTIVGFQLHSSVVHVLCYLSGAPHPYDLGALETHAMHLSHHHDPMKIAYPPDPKNLLSTVLGMDWNAHIASYFPCTFLTNMSTVSVVSWNVRGLYDPLKCTMIPTMLRKHLPAICALQEMHSTSVWLIVLSQFIMGRRSVLSFT